MIKRISRALVPAILLTLAVTARADDAAKPPQPFMQASIASADRVKQAVADLGIPLPVDLAQMIESQFTFIGEGGIDTAKPVGITFVAGEGFTPQQMVMFQFPVKAGKATVETFTGLGGTAVAGEADTVQLGEKIAFKRTADYLMIYPGDPSLLKGVANNPFAKTYAAKDTLAYMEIDAAAARTVAPKMYREFLDSIREKAKTGEKPATNAAEAQGQKIGEEAVLNAFEKIDKLTMTVSLGDKNLRLATTVMPTPMKGARTFAKPVFADTAIVTGHVAYPDAQSTQWLSGIVKQALAGEGVKDDKLTPEQQATQLKTLQSLTAAIVGDAQSFCVESNNGKVVITVVNQYQRDVNLPEELKKDIPILQELDKAAGDTKDEVVITDITGPNGSKGIKIDSAHADAAKPHGVTVLQNGKLAVITVSDDVAAAPAAITLSPSDKISDLMTMQLHLIPAIKAIEEKEGGSPLAALPEEKRKQVLERLVDKEIAITVTNLPGGSLGVNLDIPVDLLKVAGEFITQMMPAR